MSTTRTFIAVAASDAVRKNATSAITSLGRGVDSVKWVASENLHFTLQFLGDLDDATVAGVCRAVQQLAARRAPFSIRVAGAGAFPKIERPRTVWLGVEDGAEELIALQAAATNAIDALYVHLDLRPFTPHLTIGRARGRSGANATLTERLTQFADFDAGVMDVSSVTVFASELRREGPEYHVLSRAPLGG